MFGWAYVILFSQCLFLQCLLNYANKSCKGYSSDFALVGFTGYSFLLVNQLAGKVDPYSEAGKVNAMDLSFAVVATALSSASFAQTFMYPSEKHNNATSYGVAACCCFFLAVAIYQWCFGTIGMVTNIVSLVGLAAIFKAISTGGKYLYQIGLNF